MHITNTIKDNKPKKVLTKNLKSVGMTLAKVKKQDGMTLAPATFGN